MLGLQTTAQVDASLSHPVREWRRAWIGVYWVLGQAGRDGVGVCGSAHSRPTVEEGEGEGGEEGPDASMFFPTRAIG